MNKFKKATKRITAVAASAVLVSSAVFGAGLSNYPSNFVQSGAFNGQVVVGASAAAMDTTSAMSIIDDLKNEFSGANEKVKITYRSSTSGGDVVDAVKSTNQLNYGEYLQNVTETNGFDDTDTDFLADGDFDNGISDEDYEQKLTLNNGLFNYALRDEVEGVDEISNNIFYNNDDTFATYTLDFKNAINLSSSSDLDDDMVGRTLEIMGNEFTIGTITRTTGSGAGAPSKIELLGGANKVSLGEGESTSVTVDGTEYEVAVQSVSSTKVLLTINGQSKSVDEFDTEDIAGVTVAVTDIVSSSRDLVKGYAELVVGGQKVTLEDGNKLVKVNDDDVDDLYEGYEVYSDFSGTTMDVITITYKVADDIILEEGDSLRDVLFDSFEIVFEGTNEPEYSTLDITSTGNSGDADVKFKGKLISGKEFNRDLIHTTSTSGTNGATYLKGDQDSDRIFTSTSVYMTATTATGIAPLNSSDETPSNGGAIVNVSFNFSQSSIDGWGFLLYDDDDEQYLYEIDSVDTNDKEVDLKEYLDDKGKEELDANEVTSDLEVSLSTSTGSSSTGILVLELADLGTPKIAFANELLVNFADSEDALGTSANFTFTLDSDVDGDQTSDEDESWNVTLSWDSSDDRFNLGLTTSDADFVNSGNADNVDGDSDVKTFVTSYGTMIEYDNEDQDWIKVMVPEEQVYAMVNVVFGGAVSSVQTVTVDADQADAKVEELEDDGMTIVSKETVSSEEVEFDVTAPVTDADVTGMKDMIVVGGPAVNAIARELMGIEEMYDVSMAGVAPGEAVVRYFEASNSVLVYGYSAEDTKAAAAKLNAGGLTGNLVNVE